MADKKISQLTTLAQADVAVTADFLPIVDTSATETKKATPSAIVNAATTAGQVPFSAGSAATPSIAPTGDSNTGIYFPAADTIAFAEGGVESMRLDSSGNLGIGTASPGGYGGYTALAVNNATNGGLIDLMTNGTRHLTLFAGATASMIGTASNTALQIQTNGTERMRITATGNIVAGASAALATTATDGFLYVPTCAGTPTGTPTAITGMAAIVVNTTNNKLYFYSGGAWRDAGP